MGPARPASKSRAPGSNALRERADIGQICLVPRRTRPATKSRMAGRPVKASRRSRRIKKHPAGNGYGNSWGSHSTRQAYTHSKPQNPLGASTNRQIRGFSRVLKKGKSGRAPSRLCCDKAGVAIFAYRDHRKIAGFRYARRKRGLLDRLFQHPAIGVTSDLIKRIWLHKSGIMGGFSKTYKIYLLEYYEIHATMRSAITREKQVKKWNRSWKMRLIEEENPTWRDLYEEICN